MKLLFDCKKCQEEYNKKALQCRIVFDYALLLEEQDKIHKREHVKE